MVQGGEGEGLAWEAVIPVRLRGVEERPEPASRQHGNIRVLRVLTLPEDSVVGDEAADRARHRLEAKVDLLLFTLAGQNRSAIPRKRVCLFRDGLRMEVAESISTGSLMEVELWLTDEQPQPLCLSGVVTGGSSEGNDGIFLSFQELSEEESDLLERFIFQQHRRAVAAARRERHGDG
ncbi:PilZ domain-containing protein [Thiohalospira sp.]|uniref:PilZ domain-containing protein n=1 Tax=Thiohalospira sp. TaxID=3080549 RepID=UPI0039818816